MRNQCLIVFVKYPQAGLVKTRIAQVYGDEFATGLYREFLFDILAGPAAGPCSLLIYFDPPEKEAQIKDLMGHTYHYLAQQGSDLGEKMKNAFEACFAGGVEKAVLIGSDCPDLPRRIIDEAFNALDGQNDAVIGPAADGGYYLIGFKKETFLPDTFRGLLWGTDNVLSDTVKILHHFGLRIAVLEEWRDMDTGEDIADLIKRNKSTDFERSRTMCYLKKRGLIPRS